MNNAALHAQARPSVVQAQGVWREFHEGALHVSVLRGLDLRVTAGSTVAIMGASGSGKSSLLHVLGGLDKPDAGQVLWAGQDIATMTATALGRLRNRHLGFVYQFHHLLPECTALENVAMPLAIRRVAKAQREAQAATLLQQVGLAERMLHPPAALSGGERQRVALARALAHQPACLLADEPTGNLDRSSATAVFELLLELASATQTAIVLVTHDASLAARCATQYALRQGQLHAL